MVEENGQSYRTEKLPPEGGFGCIIVIALAMTLVCISKFIMELKISRNQIKLNFFFFSVLCIWWLGMFWFDF